jgi:hypothetical protein
MNAPLHHNGSPKGSIALISLLVISAFTLILVIAMAESSILAETAEVNNETNRFMDYTAEACLEEGILRLEGDPAFTDATITFEDQVSCALTVSGSAPYTLSIETTYLDHTEHFEATLNLTTSGQSNNAQLLSWEEV